jgi:hypothetical protein
VAAAEIATDRNNHNGELSRPRHVRSGSVHSFSDHTRAMLEGNWQSCRETDGQYGERVYDGK